MSDMENIVFFLKKEAMVTRLVEESSGVTRN